jgi:hypothetical protein
LTLGLRSSVARAFLLPLPLDVDCCWVYIVIGSVLLLKFANSCFVLGVYPSSSCRLLVLSSSLSAFSSTRCTVCDLVPPCWDGVVEYWPFLELSPLLGSGGVASWEL